jgi:hypothetical protein
MTQGSPYPNQGAPPQQAHAYGQQPHRYASQAPYPAGYGYQGGYAHPYAAAAPRHPGIGVTSFILGLVAGVAMVVLIVIAAAMSARAPGGQLDENSPEAITVGCSLIVAAGLALLGLILGIVGAVQQGHKKLFPVLGIVFNGGMLLMVVGLMILGAVAG